MQEVREALKRQHHAAMAMFRQAIQNCPDDVWTSGDHPRNYWRIAYHALAYAHLYLYEDLASWNKWPNHIQENTYLDGDDVPVNEPYTKQQLTELVNRIDSEIDPRLDALDLTSPTCGFTWYPNVSRVELLILSLRHIHGHLGQLHEILIAHGEDVEWLGQIK
jgi:hypothetical protein